MVALHILKPVGVSVIPENKGAPHVKGEDRAPFPLFRASDLDGLLSYCFDQGASDVTFQTDKPIFAEIDGLLHAITQTKLDGSQMSDILREIYGPNAMAQLSGNDLDFSYEIKRTRSDRVRFRVNVTGILSRGVDAYQATFRILPGRIPSLDDIDLEPEIVKESQQRQGMILFTGPTGSGKTTLLSSLIKHRSEQERSGKILTFESPIEYVYDGIQGEHSLISQTEIPRHLPSYARAIRNALRRKPEVIVSGEARDLETIMGLIEAALTGHVVYSTTHTNGVSETIPRLVAAFPSSEKAMRAWDLMESMRLIVSQMLVPKIGGGRTAIREWMAFDEPMRKALLKLPHEKWSHEIKGLLKERKSSFKDSAVKAFEAQKIDQQTVERLSLLWGRT